MQKIIHFLGHDAASVNIEYGLIALIVAVGLIGSLDVTSSKISDRYTTISNALVSSETTGSIK